MHGDPALSLVPPGSNGMNCSAQSFAAGVAAVYADAYGQDAVAPRIHDLCAGDVRLASMPLAGTLRACAASPPSCVGRA